MAAFLGDAEAKGRISSWHVPPASFLADLVAHEAHHRALAVLTLRLAGRGLPKDDLMNVWNWGRQGPLDP